MTSLVTIFPQRAPVFQAFGRQIISDFPLDRLRFGDQAGETSVVMQNSGKTYIQEDLRGGEFERFGRDGCLDGVRYTAHGVGEFLVQDGGKRITYSLAAGVAPGDVQHILTGPALIMALQLQGEFFLHCGAIERDGGVFAVSAPHGFGKSTLTAAFFRSGYAVRSDDVIPVKEHDGTFLGGQGQPWIKLWDNALEKFGDDADRYDKVLTGFDKRIIPGVTTEGELPLRTVYLLAPHLTEDKPIEFRQMKGVEAALALMANVYSPEIMIGELAARNLDFATRIAAKVPVRVVSYYRSFDNLPNIRDAIIRDFDEVVRG